MQKQVIGGLGQGQSRDPGPPATSRTAKARYLKFCMQRATGPNENYAKVSHTGSGRGHVTYIQILGPLPISRTVEARDLKVCVHIYIQLQILSKTTQSRLFGGIERDFATAYISQERLQLQSPARVVYAVHLVQPLPNYFGLLFSIEVVFATAEVYCCLLL